MVKMKLKGLAGFVSTSLLLGLGCLADLILPQTARAAEEVRLIVGGPALVFSVSVDSLARFAQTGEIPDDLSLVANFLDAETLNSARQGLQHPFRLDVVQVDNMAYSTLGRDVLQNVGKVIRVHPDVNGYQGLRGALIGAAAQAGPEGWTIVDVLRQFPTPSVDIRLQELLELQRNLDIYFGYNQAVVAAIQGQAKAEADNQPNFDPTALADLSQPGTYAFEQSTLTLTNSALRQTGQGIQVTYDFAVKTYLPEGLSQPAPVIIISHGFGDVGESFAFIAEHLASHGFVVLVPNHVGSDLSSRQNFLQGFLNTILSPSEFVSRPEEISFLMDELERLVATSPEWATRLNLEQIGVLGDSMGGSTALALAGADIIFAHLEAACDSDQLILSFALYLQCQARFLPPQNRSLGDSRVKAIIAAHPLGAALYGPEGIGQIEVPLLMVAGSQDIVAPVVTEQIHPFIWLQSDPKYLALLTEGTHFTAKPGREGAGGIFSLLAGDHRDVGTHYFKALNVAFWRAHLQGQTDYLPYLSAGYGEYLSEGEPLQLDIVRSLTPETLVTAYGRTPPIPIVPTTAATTPAPREESVRSEIERTGILKIALRQDVAPFGYIDNASNWVGYCRAFAADLRAHLDQITGPALDIDLVELSSTLENRFSLVQENIVHLECGPNTIRQDLENISFSQPLLVSGVQFLVKRDQIDQANPNPRLADIRVALLPGTTTEQFIQDTFPQAELVPFAGPTGRSEAVMALVKGEVDVFASDGILSISEALRQNLSLEEYVLQPEQPLTCEFYGLLLPADDPDWQTLINDFIARTHTERLSREVSRSLLAGQLDTLDYCLNQ